jgi:hypothetical protein
MVTLTRAFLRAAGEIYNTLHEAGGDASRRKNEARWWWWKRPGLGKPLLNLFAHSSLLIIGDVT